MIWLAHRGGKALERRVPAAFARWHRGGVRFALSLGQHARERAVVMRRALRGAQRPRALRTVARTPPVPACAPLGRYLSIRKSTIPAPRC